MPTISASAITQLGLYGGPWRRYGSFNGKSAAEVITVPGMEYTLPLNRLHYTMPVNRIHYTCMEEDG